ncbi:hypothetical protein GCM10022253_28100 [Sphingomonas endophytica]|uniref:Uncharacterized protein n=1 Tax=Sphingomonas endophytica TaxID=869719 RepID=A0ABR6N8I1_9SPHN|nr:hypothetical protein [Sphingomonas endophytica]MBB5727115.1 hypothetical protein [Sphingomonas endophytica]
MTDNSLSQEPSLFGSTDQRTALRAQAEAYVLRANLMMRRARILVTQDRVDACALLTDRRNALGQHFQRYQRLKHGSIFDPIVAYAPTSSKIVARGMKIDCMELGQEFVAYQTRWLRVPPSEWRWYKADMLATADKLSLHLDAELRAIRQLLMVAEFYQR